MSTPQKYRRWIPVTILAAGGLFWAACVLHLNAQPGGGAGSPDVIVGDIHEIRRWGTLDNRTAFSIGTISCNIGSDKLDWLPSPNPLHPVIAQNIYRIRDGRIEQLGLSWLKHGFVVAAQSTCGICLDDASNYLAVNCADPYGAGLNGSWGGLGPRSEVNAVSGGFTVPFSTLPTPRTVLDGRMSVANDDLRPEVNQGARYFVEGHYIHRQDALAAKANNNASYREVFVSAQPSGELSLTLVASSPVVRTESAIQAWKFVHPDVGIHEIDVPSDGRILIGVRSMPVAAGRMRTDIAVQNLNSHRGVRSLKATFREGPISNPTFRDVDYQHEPYSATDWPPSTSGSTMEWKTEEFTANQNANAIRWSTLYAFGCEAASGPVSIEIGLFRSGTPSSITVPLAISPLAVAAPDLADDWAEVERTVDVGPIEAGKSATFAVAGRSDGKTEKVAAKSSSEDVGVELQARDASEQPAWNIVVTPKAAAPTGYFESVVTIESDKENQKPIRVRVFGSVAK